MSGEEGEKYSLRKEVIERIPLAFVPLPGRRNPVLIVKSTNSVVIDVTVDLGGEGLELNGPVTDDLINAVAAFINEISKVTGFEGGVKVEIYGTKEVIDSFLYAAVTNSVLEILGGKVDEALIRSANIIDSRVGVDDSAKALRSYVRFSRPYLWREGEGAIELGHEILIDYEVIDKEVMNYVEPLEPDVITHLAGVSVIKASQSLRDRQELIRATRLINSLWHLIYGIPLPQEKALRVVIKGLGQAYVIEVLGIKVLEGEGS